MSNFNNMKKNIEGSPLNTVILETKKKRKKKGRT